jgi:hypothetical protein
MLSQDALKKEFSAMLETEKEKMKEQIMAKVDEKITARAKEEEKSRDALSKQVQEPSDELHQNGLTSSLKRDTQV